MTTDINGFLAILNELNRDVARAQPSDPLQFCANWFQKKLELDRQASRVATSSAGTSPPAAAAAATAPSLDVAPDDVVGGGPSPFNGFSFPPSGPANAAAAAPQFRNSWDSNASTTSTEEETELPDLVHVSSALAAPARRTSVSAESIHPDAKSARTTRDGRAAAAYPKSDAQQRRIREAVGSHLLFRNLDEEQYNEVVSAMKEQRVLEGVAVIQQGDENGDYFYVVESGTLDVYIRPENGGSSELGNKMCSYGPGATFGELALMYAQPRAATVLTTSPCTLWAVDRVTFRTILLDTSSRQRTLFDSLLKEVPLFEHMRSEERAKIADALEVREYSIGDRPVQQGERGKEFFIIIEGHAEVKKSRAGPGSSAGGAGYTGEGEEVVGRLSRGDYFGELALLHNAPRVASVVAADYPGSTEEEDGSRMEMDEPHAGGEPVQARPSKRLRCSNGKLKVALLSERAFTRLLGPLAGIMSRHARERYGAAGAAPSTGASATAASHASTLAPGAAAPPAADGAEDWELAPDQVAGTQGVWLGRSPFA